MRREAAEELAAEALAYLAGAPDAFARFLNLSGLDLDDLRARVAAGDRDLLGSAVQFLSEDEDLARGFCEAKGLSPERFGAMRAALPGGDAPHWL